MVVGQQILRVRACDTRYGVDISPMIHVTRDCVNPGRIKQRPDLIGVGSVTLTPSNVNLNIRIDSFPSHIRFPASPSLYDHDFLIPGTPIMKNRNKTTKFPVVRFPMIPIDPILSVSLTPSGFSVHF